MQKSSALEKMKEGNSIAVTIEAIDIGNRKITLAPADTKDEQNWQNFADDTGSSMGSLGEKLSQAITRKKDS